MDLSRPISRRSTLSIILVATLAAACNPDTDSGAPATTGVTTAIDTIGGVIRVANSGTPPEWQLTQLASIGPKSLDETESPDEFGRVFDVALGPDQSVYVADALNSEVRVFGLDGVHRHTFGRDGEGPGEFARLYSVAWLGDRLLALDSQQGRISEFSAEGEFLGQRRIRGGLSGGPGWVRFWRVGADEAYHVTIPVESTPGRWWEFVGVDSRGETGDTLLQLEGPRGAQIDCEHGGVLHFFAVPFATTLVQRPGTGGLTPGPPPRPPGPTVNDLMAESVSSMSQRNARWTVRADQRSPPMQRTLVALATVLAAACTPDAPAAPGDLVTTFDTIAGVIRVTNTGTAPPARLALVVSIGPKTLTDTGAPDEFGGVNSVALGPDEAVFVADGRNREIRVFGLDGAHRRTFGRSGEGPGEFGSIHSLAWVGDRLLALDGQLGRVSEFSADGEFLGQRRTQGGLSGAPAAIRLYPVGPDEAYQFAIGNDRESVFAGHDSRGPTGDTLRRMAGPPVPPSYILCESEGRTDFFPIPFGAVHAQTPGPGGVMYTTISDVYRISVLRSESDTVRVIERTLPPEPVLDDEWEAGNEEFEEFRRRRRSANCEPNGPTRPDMKPFTGGMHIAPDGKLWVRVIRTAGNRWEVFDTDGRLLGSVPTPTLKERVVASFGPGHLLTIRQDSLDLDHIDVWRFETESGPSR